MNSYLLVLRFFAIGVPIALKLCRNASLSTLNIGLALAFLGRTVLLVFTVFALINTIA